MHVYTQEKLNWPLRKTLRIVQVDKILGTAFTSQKHAAYEHSGDEGTRFVMSRSLVLRPIAAVKAPLDI